MSKELDDIQETVKRMVAAFQEQHLVIGIQVFVTVKIGDNCCGYAHGGGDFYSRLGYMNEWMERQKAAAWWQVKPEAPPQEL